MTATDLVKWLLFLGMGVVIMLLSEGMIWLYWDLSTKSSLGGIHGILPAWTPRVRFDPDLNHGIELSSPEREVRDGLVCGMD